MSLRRWNLTTTATIGIVGLLGLSGAVQAASGGRAASITQPGRIVYTATQKRQIQMQTHQTGLTNTYVPMRDTPWAQFKAVSHYKTATSPARPVLMLSYSNLRWQESTSLNAFSSGGDVVAHGTVTLHIHEVSQPVPAHWEDVQGHGSPAVRGMEFAIDGNFYSLSSTTLTLRQLVSVTESVKRSAPMTQHGGIVYAAAQRQEILMQAHRAHIPSVYVPVHDTPWTKFTGATHYIITTSQPSWTMLSVSYTNIGFQESANPNAFGSGGLLLGRGTVALHIRGLSHSIPAHWIKVQGRVGPPSWEVNFRLGNLFYSFGSVTLSLHPLVSVIDSIQPLK